MLVKKRQISSYCRHILTFPAHLNFVSRSTSSMVLELSSGASSTKKQGHLHRWLKKRQISSYFDISSTLDLHNQVYIFNGSRTSFGGIQPEEKQGNLHRWLKKSDILLQTYFDICSTFKLHKQVWISNGSRV